MDEPDESMQEALALFQSSPDERPEVRANRFYERAKHLVLVGSGSSVELERTLRDVLKALSFSPDNPTYYMFLAKIYKSALDITSALFCYRYVIRLEPNNYQAKRFLCELLAIKGKELMTTAKKTDSQLRFRSARACFDEALEMDRENASLWVLKAVCHVNLEENLEAYECINRIIRTGKGINAEMYVLRAKIQWARGLTEQGNTDIKQAGRLNPDHVEVLAYTNRSYAKAEKLYKESVADFTAGKYKEALMAVDYAIHITTDDIKLLIMQAKIYRKLGDLQKAYDSMLRAKSICENAKKNSEFPLEIPTDITAQINLILNDMAINYAMKGDYDNAILLLNKIVKTEKETARSGLLKSNHKYFVNRGDCYRALHRLTDAVQDYEMALKLAPKEWTIATRLSLTHYMIATDIFNGTSEFYDAITHLDKAISYNPKVAEYYVVRGKAHYYTSNFNAAHRDYLKALELDETKDEIRERLSQFDDLMSDQAQPKAGAGAAKPDSKQNKNNNNNAATAAATAAAVAGIQALQPRTTDVDSTSGSVAGTIAVGGSSKAILHKDSTIPGKASSRTAAPSMINNKKVMKDFHKLPSTKHVEKVLKVKIKEDDAVDMMLSPKKASKLPNLRLLSRSADAGLSTKEHIIHDRNVRAMFRNRKFTTGGGELEGGADGVVDATKPHTVHKRTQDFIPDFMKEVDEYADLPDDKKQSAFRDAWKASNTMNEKNAHVRKMLEARVDNSRGSLWGMVETAKELAYKKSHPRHEHKTHHQVEESGITPRNSAGVVGAVNQTPRKPAMANSSKTNTQRQRP